MFLFERQCKAIDYAARKQYIERILHGGAKIRILFSSRKAIIYKRA